MRFNKQKSFVLFHSSSLVYFSLAVNQAVPISLGLRTSPSATDLWYLRGAKNRRYLCFLSAQLYHQVSVLGSCLLLLLVAMNMDLDQAIKEMSINDDGPLILSNQAQFCSIERNNYSILGRFLNPSHQRMFNWILKCLEFGGCIQK